MINKTIRCFCVLMCVLMILSCSVLFASAADTANVNGTEIMVGDTFTYTFNISDAHQAITGIQMVVFYDRSVLELQSASDGVLGGSSMINEDSNKEGRITIVNGFMNGGGLKCEDPTVVFSATFKVIADADTEITYFMQYLYDIDMIDIYSYTFTYDILSDTTVISQGNSPILADDSLTEDLVSYDTFQNNADGKGDDIRREPATLPPGTTPSVAETEGVLPTSESAQPQSTNSEAVSTEDKIEGASEVNKDENRKSDKNDKEDDKNPLVIFLAGGATVLILVAVGVMWFIISKKTKN